MGRELSKALLMHKDHVVAELTLESNGGLVHHRINAAEIEHVPLGGQMNDMRFREWWKDRATPKTRQGALSALERLGYSSTSNMLVDNLALSLTDCYWIRPFDADITWKDVNLFSNPFEDIFGQLTFNPEEKFDLRSRTMFIPASSQGEVQKKWCISSDGTRFLVKGNYGDSFQQSINEVFASQMHQMLGFSHAVQYSLTEISLSDGRTGLGCSCNSFCSENIEAVSAWDVLQLRKTRKNESFFYPLKEECVKLGVKEDDFDKFISYEIMSDFLISNTDRHMNNISILRNPDTLQVIGMAPIYDSGNSMFFRDSMRELQRVMPPVKTCSFIQDEKSLLKYVTDRNLIDLNRLHNIDFGIYEHDTSERHVRIPYLKHRFEQKTLALDEFQRGRDIWKPLFSKSWHVNLDQPTQHHGLQTEQPPEYIKPSPEFIALCGIPGSGKSLKAEEIAQENPNSKIVSLSRLRYINTEFNDEPEISATINDVKKHIREAMRDGKTVIYDATNILPEHRSQWISFAEECGASKKTIIVMQVDVETALVNCLEHGTPIPIDKMKEKYFELQHNFPVASDGWDEVKTVQVPSRKLTKEQRKLVENPHHESQEH